MQEQDERRRFVRLNFLVDVVYHKRPSTEKEKLSLSKNISGGGICLIVYEELKKSQLLDLEIYLPKEEMPIKALGKTAWVNEFVIGDASKGVRYDVGIEFIKINKEDLDKVNKYVFEHGSVKH